MNLNKIKSYAKINLALNVIKKSDKLHIIESLISFIDIYDVIFIKKIKSKKNHIIFRGKFSKNIKSNNTVSKLFKVLHEKKYTNERFFIKIMKNIPQKAGLGGGSMNAAFILKYLIKKKIIKVSKKQISQILEYVGSDTILGMDTRSAVLTSNNTITRFGNTKKFYTLIVKPTFGCSTKDIYSQVKKFDKIEFKNPKKIMFKVEYLKKLNNSLEKIVLDKYFSLKKTKFYLENLENPIFVRMTGSGSAFVSYYVSKKQCDKAKKLFNKKYKKYWCISSKTI